LDLYVKKTNPLVSIIIATYNRPERIQKAVQSARTQTIHNIEIIIVDDHSDKVVTLSDFHDDDRIMIIRNPANYGVSVTRNRGISRASGEWVTFLDDDDYWEPNFIESMLTELGHNYYAEFAWSDVTFKNESTGEITRKRHIDYGAPEAIDSGHPHFEMDSSNPEDPYEMEKMAQVMTVGSGYGFTVRTALLHKMGGFNPQMLVSGDTDLIVRLLINKTKYTFLNKALVNVSIHDSPKIMSDNNIEKRIFYANEILVNYEIFFARYPQRRAGLRSHIGKLAARLRQDAI
jgi:glycosyltransferase involved in cell wall biosynthesis